MAYPLDASAAGSTAILGGLTQSTDPTQGLPPTGPAYNERYLLDLFDR